LKQHIIFRDALKKILESRKTDKTAKRTQSRGDPREITEPSLAGWVLQTELDRNRGEINRIRYDSMEVAGERIRGDRVFGEDWKFLTGQLKRDFDGTRNRINLDRSLKNDAGSAAALQAKQVELVQGKVRSSAVRPGNRWRFNPQSAHQLRKAEKRLRTDRGRQTKGGAEFDCGTG
jgi:hypothetical protein